MYYFSFFRRTALYGVISFIVSIFVLRISFNSLYLLAKNENYCGVFCSYMLISLIAYPILIIFDGTIGYLITKYKYRNNDYFTPSVLKSMFSPFPVDLFLPVTNTILFIKMLKKDSDDDGLTKLQKINSVMEVVVGFIWTICLVFFIGIGFLLISRV